VSFVLMCKSARPKRNDVIDLRYGTSLSDPKPFILSVTAQYIAHETQGTVPTTYREMKDYVDKNADRLKAIAENCKARGLNAETL
jgi:hypothetical protein